MKHSLSNTDNRLQMSTAKNQFSDLEFCELLSKLNENIKKLTSEVLSLKLSNEALSMQTTDLSKSSTGNSDDIDGYTR